MAGPPWLASDAGRARNACVQKSTDGPWSSQKWQSATMPFMAVSLSADRPQAVVTRCALAATPASSTSDVLNQYRLYRGPLLPFTSRFGPITDSPQRSSPSSSSSPSPEYMRRCRRLNKRNCPINHLCYPLRLSLLHAFSALLWARFAALSPPHRRRLVRRSRRRVDRVVRIVRHRKFWRHSSFSSARIVLKNGVPLY